MPISHFRLFDQIIQEASIEFHEIKLENTDSIQFIIKDITASKSVHNNFKVTVVLEFNNEEI